MRRLFASLNLVQVGLLRSLLEAEGIACQTRNEQIASAAGAIPFLACCPELWVVHDDDFARAEELLARWEAPPETSREPWSCQNCGEELEGQFTTCWLCGADGPDSAPSAR